MMAQLLSFTAGLVAFVFYMAVFLVLIRLRPGMGWFSLQLAAASIIHVLSSILFSYLLKSFLYWHALGVFSVGWFCFFTLSTAIYVSISARILRTIHKYPGQSLPLEDIFRVCVREPFRERAEFLVASGLAQKGEIGYRITDAGDKNARRVHSLRRLFGMEESGLYSLAEGLKDDKRRKK
jgi:hypothetical protein